VILEELEKKNEDLSQKYRIWQDTIYSF